MSTVWRQILDLLAMQFFAAASDRDPGHLPLLRSWARMEATVAGSRADSNGSGESAQPGSSGRENGRAAQPSLPDRILLQVQLLQCCSQANVMYMIMCSRRSVHQTQAMTPCGLHVAVCRKQCSR